MKQIHVHISGFVQGVGFRVFVKKKAQKLGLTGWVRNLSDGRVEAVIQGEEEKLKELLKHIHKGSYFSDVKNVLVKEEKVVEKFIEMLKKETV